MSNRSCSKFTTQYAGAIPLDLLKREQDRITAYHGQYDDALSWAAEAKKMGQADPATKGGPLVAGSNLTRLGWLTGLEPAATWTTTRCSTY